MKKTYLLILLTASICNLFAAELVSEVNGTLIDLTPNGVEITNVEVTNGDEGTKLISLNDLVFFVGKDATSGEELWVTDGSSANTFLLKDIETGSGSSYPTNFCLSNGHIYFTATTSTNGTELWKTDGTGAGTVLVKDIYTGTNSSSPTMLTDFNGKLLFRARDLISNLSGQDWLWISDGTAVGTKAIGQVQPFGGGDSYYKYIQIVGDLAFFPGEHLLYGKEIWVTDGTEEGSHMLLDVNFAVDSENPNEGPNGEQPTKSSEIRWLYKVNEKQLIFRTGTPSYWINHEDEFDDIGRELWVTDGTIEGTYSLGDFNKALEEEDNRRTQDCEFAFPIRYSGKVYFRANDGVHEVELCETDLTINGTKHTQNINGAWEGNESPSWIHDLCVFDGKLYFRNNVWVAGDFEKVGEELFGYDANTGNAFLAANLCPDTYSTDNKSLYSSSPKHMIVVNNKMYFHANDEAKASDGTGVTPAGNNRKIFCMKPESERVESDTLPYLLFDEDGIANYHNLINSEERLFFISNIEVSDNVFEQKLYIYDDGDTDKTPYDSSLIVGPTPVDDFTNRNEAGYVNYYEGIYSSTRKIDAALPNLIKNIYPNPASDIFTIEIEEGIDAAIVLYDINGRAVYNNIFNISTQIDVTNLQSGVYVLHIRTDNGVETGRINIE